MERQELILIGSKIAEGLFDDLLEVLDKGSNCLTTKQAIYLIVCCCTTCNSNINTCNKLNEQQLIAAVKGLSIYIKDVTSQEYDSYLQSIFFICKLLMKKHYPLILELENEILPSFIPKILTEKQKNVYTSICDLIQMEVVNLAMKRVEVDEKKIIFMGHLLSKIIMEQTNHSKFLEHVFKYGGCLQRLNIDLTLQYEYFLYNMNKMVDLKIETLSTGIIQFFKYGIHLFSTYLNNGMLELSEQCIDDMLRVVPREWIGHEEILKICKYIIDPNADKNNFGDLRGNIIKSFKLNRKSENFQSIFKILSQAMVSYATFVKNHDEKKIFADPEKHMIIYEILSIIIEILFKLSGSCTEECKCVSKSPECSESALCILILFSALLVSNDIAKDYMKKVRSILEKYFEFLVLRKLNNCEIYKKYWSDIAPYLHNVGVLLFRKEMYEEAISFVNITLKYHSLLSVLEDDIILPNTFNLLYSIYLKQKKFEEALLWSAVEIINTKKSSRDKTFHKWIKTKAVSKGECSSELQECTIVSITKSIPKKFICFLGPIQTREAQIDFLISELEMYHSKWKSKIPMMSSFRHLCQIADHQTIMKTFIKVFTDDEIRVHEDVRSLLKNVFRELENSSSEIEDGKTKLYLAFFYFFQYKHQTVDLIAKNLEEMDKAKSLMKKDTGHTDDAIPADALDRCDVISAYENLKVSGDKLKYLEKSLRVLETIVLPNLGMSIFDELDPKKIFDLTKNISIEYILHSDSYNALRSLLVTFSLAEFLNDNYLLLECSGYFLRYLNISHMEMQMKPILCKLVDDKNSYKCLLEYYMNVSYFYLSNRNIALAYHHYRNALKYWGYLTRENGQNLWCIEVNMELLLFKMMNVAKSMNFETEMKFSYGPLMKAYNMIVDRYSTETQWTTYSMVTLLEVFETLIKMYHDLKMPREVRCFGKQSLSLAQQHVIPTCSAKILVYLAYADLWSEKFDDCRVKLDGISDILLLDKIETYPRIIKQKEKSTIPSVNDIMEGINEMMLDNPPQSAFNIISSPASPVFQGQTYKCPLFMTHRICECFHCTSMECQQTVLSRYHLEALWYMHKGQITLADSFFKGTFKLHEALLDKRKDIYGIFDKYIAKYFKNIPNIPKENKELILPFDDIKIHASVSYTKFLTSSGAQEAAKKFNENALKKFAATKINHPYLYGELLIQKIALVHKLREKEEKNMQCVELYRNDENGAIIKTPETQTSKIVIPKINSPKKKKFLPPKVIKFNLADTEDQVTPSRTMSNSLGKTPKSKNLPPSLRLKSTPKLKTPSQKKKIDADCRTLAPEINQNITSGNDIKYNYPLSEISDSAILNNSEQVTNSERKTKLLTSRLRKKNVSENNLTDTEKVIENKDDQPMRRSRRNRT